MGRGSVPCPGGGTLTGGGLLPGSCKSSWGCDRLGPGDGEHSFLEKVSR